MSNEVYLYRVERNSVNPKESGYNLGDSFYEETRWMNTTYTWKKRLGPGIIGKTDKDLLEYVVEHCEGGGQEILKAVIEEGTPLSINGNYYELEQVNSILKKLYDRD